MVSLVDPTQQNSATKREAATQSMQQTVDQKVKAQVESVKPELSKLAESVAQSAAQNAATSSASGSMTISFSASQKANLVSTTVRTAVDQFGAGLSEAHKGKLTAQLTEIINYSLRGELEKIESRSADQRRQEIDEPVKGSMAGLAVSKKSSSRLGASALFSDSSNAASAEISQANDTKRTFGFGNSAANSSEVALPQLAIAQAIGIASPGISSKEPALQKTAQPMGVKEIEAIISGVFKSPANQVTIASILAAMKPLQPVRGMLEEAKVQGVNPAQSRVAQEITAPRSGSFLLDRHDASSTNFLSHLKHLAKGLN